MNKKRPLKSTKSFKVLLGILVIIFIALVVTLINFVSLFKKNVISESREHLSEITRQMQNNIEKSITDDWNIGRTLASVIETNPYSNLEELLSYMKQRRDIWGVTSIEVITESGFSIDCDGKRRNNDIASALTVNAIENGRYLSIIQSTLTYLIPVNSTIEIHGSKIVAVSIVQNLDMYLENFNLSSFNNSAYAYLTQDNGICISQTISNNAPYAFNIKNLFEGNKYTDLSGKNFTIDQVLASCGQESCSTTFLVELGSKGNKYYCTVDSIMPESENWKIFYFVSEEIVNANTNQFSFYLIFIVVLLALVFLGLAGSLFLLMYNSRKNQFVIDLSIRDKMLSRIVENSKNAFELLLVNKEPMYASSNIKSFIGFDYFLLKRTENKYYVEIVGGNSKSLGVINESLSTWDGKSDFISSYIKYGAADRYGWYSLRIYPSASGVDEYIIIIQDLTKEKEREDALRNALDMANSASNAKTQFLANVSHEIRTPMNAIINCTDFALETAKENAQLQEYLNMIKDSSKHLLAMINDILDISRIESGKKSVNLSSFDLQDCIIEVTEMIKQLANSKQQTFKVDTSKITCFHIISDKQKLSQVLINLLNNAIKFTPFSGTIEFEISQLNSLRKGFFIYRFVVKDNGIGIAEQKIDSIFEPFTRVSNAVVSGIEGTGLGLSICKNYIASLGGTITCKSEVGKGSEFTFEIPCEEDVNYTLNLVKDVKKEVDATFKGMRALLVEDNKVNRKIAILLLEKMGFEVETAVDGQDAIAKFVSSPPSYFDIIYMDIQMPILNGYDATTAIRHSSHIASTTIPIIAMTANVFVDDIERSRKCGMNAHVGKPISVEELFEATKKVLIRG